MAGKENLILKRKIQKLCEKIHEKDKNILKLIEKAEKNRLSEQEKLKDIEMIEKTLAGKAGFKKTTPQHILQNKIYFIYEEYLQKLIKWKKEQKYKLNIPFPDLKKFLNNKRKQLLKKTPKIEIPTSQFKKEDEKENNFSLVDIRAKDKYWNRKEEKIKEREVIMPIKNKNKWKAKSTSISPPNSEDRKNNRIIEHIRHTTSSLEKILFKDNQEHFVKRFESFKKKVSLYQTAKEINIKWPKLKNILEKINFLEFFSEIYENGRRKTYYLDKPLFDKYYPLIQYYLKTEGNYRDWIKFLKRQGWTKSNTSHFIKRRIKKGIVPRYYFDWVPPRQLYFSHLLKRKKDPAELPRDIWKESFLTHKEIIKKLKKENNKLIAKIILTTRITHKK